MGKNIEKNMEKNMEKNKERNNCAFSINGDRRFTR